MILYNVTLTIKASILVEEDEIDPRLKSKVDMLVYLPDVIQANGMEVVSHRALDQSKEVKKKAVITGNYISITTLEDSIIRGLDPKFVRNYKQYHLNKDDSEHIKPFTKKDVV